MFIVKIADQLTVKDLGLIAFVSHGNTVISRRLRGYTVDVDPGFVGLILDDEAVGHPNWILGVPAKSLVTLSDEEPMPAWERELLTGE